MILSLPLFLNCSTNIVVKNEIDNKEEGKKTEIVSETEPLTVSVEISSSGDPGLTLYRNPTTRISVIDFYTELTGNSEVSNAILRGAEANDIPLALAFALAWGESRFNPRAVNQNLITIDRGLFQLNSKTFPTLSPAECFTPKINAEYGLAHFRWCLREGKNEIVAIAIYNAGKGRVEKGGTPRTTLDHINNILDYRTKLEENFMAWMHERPNLKLCMN
jgi:soluble lytic murein transglycosylase-like protein